MSLVQAPSNSSRLVSEPLQLRLPLLQADSVFPFAGIQRVLLGHVDRFSEKGVLLDKLLLPSNVSLLELLGHGQGVGGSQRSSFDGFYDRYQRGCLSMRK